MGLLAHGVSYLDANVMKVARGLQAGHGVEDGGPAVPETNRHMMTQGGLFKSRMPRRANFFARQAGLSKIVIYFEA
jgi:hypothetical protein